MTTLSGENDVEILAKNEPIHVCGESLDFAVLFDTCGIRTSAGLIMDLFTGYFAYEHMLTKHKN